MSEYLRFMASNPTALLASLLLSCDDRLCDTAFVKSELGAGADAMIDLAVERKQVRHSRRNGVAVLVWH